MLSRLDIITYLSGSDEMALRLCAREASGGIGYPQVILKALFSQL